MRVAQLIAPKTFRLNEMSIEAPGPGEVQVRVEAVGICGSDLHAYTEGAVGSTPNVYPMVLGHEPAGVIVKTGAGVSGLSAGDRGALEPALYCYHCEFCLTGHHNVCANSRSNHETDEALDLLRTNSAWFAPVLTHTRTIDYIDEAFQIASQYQDGVGKMIVRDLR